jgi:hypothetical protein
MNIVRPLLAATLLCLGGSALAGNTSANAIVGLWDTQVTAGPCPSGPVVFHGRGLNVFHAGGTISATNNLPPASNGPTYGTWRYLGHGQYRVRMQFYRFLPDGSFDGIQDIHRHLLISADRQRTEETTFVRVLNPDDSLRTTLCGAATAQRVR